MRLCWLALLPLACAHPMGATEHEAAARQDETDARRYQMLGDPSLAVYLNGCYSGRPHAAPCWSRDRDPTEENLALAALLRRRAQDHRAASAALREAEARACSGLSASERDISPFVHVEDIESVEALEEPGTEKQPVHVRGARIALRHVPGLTAARLQRQLDCHLARNAALGQAQRDEPGDPLDVPGVTASVVNHGGRLSVTLVASRSGAGSEVAARALRLSSPKAGPSGPR